MNFLTALLIHALMPGARGCAKDKDFTISAKKATLFWCIVRLRFRETWVEKEAMLGNPWAGTQGKTHLRRQWRQRSSLYVPRSRGIC